MAIFISRLWTQPILITAMLASSVNITGCAKKAEQQEAKPQEITTLNIGFQKYGILPIVKAKGELEKKPCCSRRKCQMGGVSSGSTTSGGLECWQCLFG